MQGNITQYNTTTQYVSRVAGLTWNLKHIMIWANPPAEWSEWSPQLNDLNGQSDRVKMGALAPIWTSSIYKGTPVYKSTSVYRGTPI